MNRAPARPTSPEPDPEPPKPPTRKRPPLALVTDLYTGATRSRPKSARLELVPDPVPAAASVPVKDSAAVENPKPAPKAYDNTPGRKTRAHYQHQLAIVRRELEAGRCKPNARAIGKCAGCNMQRAQSIAADLVDAGVLERLPNRRLRVVSSAVAA